MNNGKVRIYELSRELNLDNKDILNICEDLNIAVKSHSSTITESDVDRIRMAAEKYTDRQGHNKGRGVTSEGGSGSSATKVVGRPKVQPKQQILEIRKPKARPSASAHQDDTPVAKPPEPPPKPSTPSPQSSNQPTLKRPPARPSKPPAPRTEPTEEAETQQQADQQEVSQPKTPEKPELIKPPARPVAPKPQPKQVGRPTQGRDRAEVSSAPAPSKTSRKEQESTSAEPTPSAPARPEPSMPKLQRPTLKKPPKREAEDQAVEAKASPQETEEEGVETILDEDEDIKLQLKRPTLPRGAKKAKSKLPEEDEEETESAKGGKASKLKRRPKRFLEDEDEEELENQIGSAPAPVAVSMSIARPPKPKSMQGQSKAASVPSPAARKKPTPKGSDTGKTDSRERRREKKETPELPEKLVLSGSLTIRELANELGIAETEIVKQLFFKGIAVSVTQTLDIPTAKMVAEELGVEVETAEEKSGAAKETEWLDAEDLENLQRRPPVVTIMGHVDHGKTTLLDSIRSTKVAQGEAGGITQHIGAYHVDVDHEEKMEQVVFLDTPGHEAFTAMRARGTRVTDIAVLVVAADDGVRPQTLEAISHAKAAGVPLVVAINKIDKAEAQPDRVKQELAERGLVPEEWGGDTIMVPVSAIKGENLDSLLEMILLVADIEELSANPGRLAKGTVIEANLDKARGPVATLLVQNGTLRVGDSLVAGSVFGKVRAMVDDLGERVEEATPSFAVEVLGLNDVPEAGDEFEVFETEKQARSVADKRGEQQRQTRLQQMMSSRRVTLSSLSAQAQEGELKELNLILKADVQGSVEAILGSLKQLPQNEVQIRVLLAAPGEVTETDIDLAAASGAVIIGFSTTLAQGARQRAEQEGVDVREYNIIYNLLDDIQAAMEGLLEPEEVEEHLGEAEVRAVFPVGRGAVAGCYVRSGQIVRNCRIRVHRGGKVVYQGVLDSLKRMKDDVKEVKTGFECGIGVDKFNDWQEGDTIEAYKMVMKRRTLSPA